MIALSSPITTEIAATQSGWTELYDIYLKSAIVTPWGTTSILRLGTAQGNISFFTPKLAPEAGGNQGVAATYYFWPVTRDPVKGDGKFTSDRMHITASNVTTEWAAMLGTIDWYDTPIIIRKVPLSIVGPTADDCAVLWSGLIDAIKVTEKAIGMECSSDLAGLQVVAPRENMHTNCRFRWADDQCTRIRYLAANYKSGTVGSSSTTTRVKSAGFTEDSGATGSYGTDLINALADANVTASSDGGNLTNALVTVTDNVLNLAAHGLSKNDAVTFTATVFPSGIAAATTYYAIPQGAGAFSIAATPDGSKIFLGTGASNLRVSTPQNYSASAVKSGNVGYWKLGLAADWGTETDGFFQIPDAQAGTQNSGLKPYIQFDLGSAKAPKLWRISSVLGVRLEELPRLITLYGSSSSSSGFNFFQHFEMPPRSGILYEMQVPSATAFQYWRICVRSRWAQAVFFSLFSKVYAYEDSRHYWQSGRITFAINTTTPALQGISRRVLESYSGEVVVPALPIAPVNGDTFVIERGCNRSFNACGSRLNQENFGGFLDLPYQQVIR